MCHVDAAIMVWNRWTIHGEGIMYQYQSIQFLNTTNAKSTIFKNISKKHNSSIFMKFNSF